MTIGLYIVSAFLLVLITHGIAMYAGWRMGNAKDKVYPTSKQKEHTPGVDEIDAERLDWR